MNTIHHFGDSYGKTIESTHFVEICSQKLNKKYLHNCVGGSSNEIILKIILQQINSFKINDIVFIQFSYLCRGNWWNENTQKIENTNHLYDEIYKNKYFEIANDNKKLLFLIEYYLTYTEDYSRRIFNIINVVLEQLIAKGIHVYFIHIDDSEYINSLLEYGFNIKFEKGFGKWLLSNKFHNEEDAHYTKYIQPMLSDIILNVTNNLTTSTGISDVIKLSLNKTII